MWIISLPRSIINTKDKIFMSAHCGYSTNNPIYLTLFPSPFTNRASPFLFASICFFFLTKAFFCLINFTGSFVFNFNLFCLGLIWFFDNLDYFHLFLVQFSFPKWTSNDSKLFSATIRKLNQYEDFYIKTVSYLAMGLLLSASPHNK